MSFLYPLGLLGLLGVPVLILIYLLKNKYTEQTVASTYLWRLSEKFLKRKNPINKIVGIVSLILQIFIVIMISLSVAHPVLILKGSAKDYCFVLDASGSMNMQSEGKTRFERGKEYLSSLIDSTLDGSSYTLLSVGDSTLLSYEKITNKEQAKQLLMDTAQSYGEADFTAAFQKAQDYFTENSSLKTYFVTDRDYEESDNVEVVNLAAGESNFAVSNVSYRLDGGLTVTGDVYAYAGAASVRVALYVDESETPAATAEIAVSASSNAPFTLTAAANAFSVFRVRVQNGDALALDDEWVVHNVEYENSYRTLLVSDTPNFILASLRSVGVARLTSVTVKEYEEKYAEETGYGLYVFDCYAPENLPRDGAVWFFNLNKSIADAGFSVQGEVTLDAGDTLTYTNSSASLARQLTKNLLKEDVYIAQYIKCGLYRNFTTLMSYQGNPVVFTGTNRFGNREVVFAFDLHKSDFPVRQDFTSLVRNLIGFSFPEVLTEVSYYCGDTAQINLIANCDSVRVESPQGNVSYLDLTSAVTEFRLTEVGEYAVVMTVRGSAEPRTYYIYAALPEAERFVSGTEQSCALTGAMTDGGVDGRYDNLFILIACLAVLFLADWGVYCYEQYQLR